MRKFLISIAAVLLIAMLVPVAFADTDNQAPAVGNYPSALTQDEVDQVKPVLDKILDLRKELIQKYADMGKITQDDANARMDWMEQNHNTRIQDGFVPGYGRGGRGGCGGPGAGGYGGCGGGGCYGTTPAPTSNQL